MLLLQAGADPNLAQYAPCEGETPFLTAARWGAANVLTDLAGAGADVNATAYSSYLERVGNAAMWGSMYRSAANLATLQECGTDLTYISPDGVSASSLAVDADCLESLGYLVQEARVPDPGGTLTARFRRDRAHAQQ